jgi:hypothetical protein
MTLTPELDEVIKSTDTIFGDETLVIPEPSADWKRRLEALEEASLVQQRSALVFEMRCWQAKELGFRQILVSDAVKMIFGEPHTEEAEGAERQNHEWMYRHDSDTVLEGEDCNWGGKPTQYVRIVKKGLWYLPPFAQVETWRCQFGKLDYLKREIPYGIVLRINELKKLKLFNAFQVLAPMEAWIRKTDIDPIVMASVWEFGDNKVAQAAHFFIARWE